eukprot:COSAG06_NODE_51549_length_311_cov_0.957547_1_plen_70_part_01
MAAAASADTELLLLLQQLLLPPRRTGASGSQPNQAMDDAQRYSLDLQGFLHIAGALGAAELERCRAAADR